MIKILWDFDLDLSLEKIFDELLDLWKISLPNLNFIKQNVLDDLIEFLIQRIISHLEEILLDKEIVKAICSSDELYKQRIINIVDLKNRIKCIALLKEKDEFDKIQNVITRVSKLANRGNLDKDILLLKNYVTPDLFEKECESKVFKFVRELEKLFYSDNFDYLKLLTLFENNANNIKDLFDNENGILVMSDDLKIRNNRLNLLSLLRNYSLRIADFTLLNS